MSSSEAFRPSTTIQEPSIQGMPRFYSSTREVAAEWDPPVRGTVLGDVFGQRYKLHIVLDASVQPSPSGGKLIATVTHCPPSAWNILLNSEDRDNALTFLSQQQVVPTPAQATIEADHLATYVPIDETKSIKRTKVPRRRKSDGTYEDGYPKRQKKTKGSENLTPQKFRRLTTTILTTTQETLDAGSVNNIPAPDALTGNQTLVEHEKVTDHRYEKRVLEEEITENASPLAGQIAYVEKEKANTTETVVVEGTAATTGLLVSSSKVDPIGNGKSIKTDITVPAWTEHQGCDWDPTLGISLPYTEQFVAPGDGIGQPNTSLTPVNKDRSLKVVQAIPDLDDYLTICPSKMRIDIPRVLESATVVWNTSTDLGTQMFAFNKVAVGDSYSLGTNYSDRASSSASVQADVQLVWKDYGNGNIMGEEYSFYLPNPVTLGAIQAKCGASAYWPQFKTSSPSITVTGQSIQVQCNASCGLDARRSGGVIVSSGWQYGTSDNFGVTLSGNTIQIPPCLHSDLSFVNQEITVSATANVTMFHSDVGPIAAILTKSGTAYGKCVPLNIAATSLTDIPKTGKFIADASVRPYRWGYSYVTVQVFDASIFA